MIVLTATITKENGSLINLTSRNSFSIERSIFDRSNFETADWGVISNGGNLKFVDSDGEIKRLAVLRQIKSGMLVNLYLENTLAKSKSNIGQFLTEKWNYDNDNRQVSVTFKDELEEWQDIVVEKVVYNPFAEKNLSFEWLYNYLFELTPSKYDMLKFESLDEDTKIILSNRKFEFFILDAKNLWSAWTQFCVACQCHIYKDNNGKTVCKYNGGN
jgi:hypothetical protein